MSLVIALDAVCKKHLTGAGHLERPERYDAVSKAVGSLERLPIRSATDQELMLCHSERYLKKVSQECSSLEKKELNTLTTGDVVICSNSDSVARYAVGAALTITDAIVSGRAATGFSGMRPPGHHATRDQGMGFCLFNTAAIAARYIQKQHGIERVLIVDWDVHHGNGTQDIFYNDPTVFYFSTHRFPFYPMTGNRTEIGEKEGEGYTLNCPYEGGEGTAETISRSIKEKLAPAMSHFKPEWMIISAGFDAHRDDPLGGCDLTDLDYKTLTKQIGSLAREHHVMGILSILEGGYSLSALESSIPVHLDELSKIDVTLRNL